MADLLLDSLEIENFRAFKHLKIERLGRVNLIVGRNSVGKTALLEALSLFANRGTFQTTINILRSRNELNNKVVSGEVIEDDKIVRDALKTLFYGRNFSNNNIPTTKIGLTNFKKGIKINVADYTLNGTQGVEEFSSINFEPNINSIYSRKLTIYMVGVIDDLPHSTQSFPIERGLKFNQNEETNKISNNFVSSNGVKDEEISQLWGNITLTNLENTVIEALGIIIPEIERVALVHEPGITFDRTILVKMRNEEGRVSLRSFGDGLNRIFGIALALVNSKDGILLIDEIENGLHFTAQLGLWRLIFATARQLNVQVFATTHSWDCIQAFQQAASEDTQQEGMLIRLDKVNDEIVPVLVDEERLGILTREQIEVR